MVGEYSARTTVLSCQLRLPATLGVALTVQLAATPLTLVMVVQGLVALATESRVITEHLQSVGYPTIEFLTVPHRIEWPETAMVKKIK